MIGGGEGSFIGAVHRMAAALDGHYTLVCGAFSSDPIKSISSGDALNLQKDRIYQTYEEMLYNESKFPPDIRMQIVSIVTPNDQHYKPIKLAIELGFHVICDKPMTLTLEEAIDLKKVVNGSDKIFALTHTYSGYPMVKQAKFMVQQKELGNIRKIVVEYPQGWLSYPIEKQGQKQAAWRTDPKKSGISGAMGDIGTHAAHLAEYISGLKITHVCADISTMVSGRVLDDDGNILLRFENEARGILYASQISAGEENNLRIRIYGEKGSLDWSQMEPNTLTVRWQEKPIELLRTGGIGLCNEANRHTRLPSGHPEGYIEAFANIYQNVAICIQSKINGISPDPIYVDFPTVEDGVRGMQFIYKVIESGQSQQKWISVPS
ncbi:MAG: Gfo/Idh/MocA family oxidoreductase [Saprospiraceae bacterium]|nr:Gfo/Idh/MocA family oxidoreductase [Saprospiraceae bacterium]